MKPLISDPRKNGELKTPNTSAIWSHSARNENRFLRCNHCISCNADLPFRIIQTALPTGIRCSKLMMVLLHGANAHQAKAIWGLFTDISEIVPLTNKSRSIHRFSAGTIGGLDSIGLLLLLGAAVNWVVNDYKDTSDEPTNTPVLPVDTWLENTLWIGCAVA